MIELLRVVVVIALVMIAAILATPLGRIPLALRGVYRIMRKDRGEDPAVPANGSASLKRRLLAFLLVIVAIILACMSIRVA